MRRASGLAFSAIVLLAAAAHSVAAAAPTAAVFPVELWDTSGEGAKADQAEKLAHATDILAAALDKSGRFAPLDLSPYKAAIEKASPRYACNGCWRPIAKDAGAEFAVLSTIHKVSSLISSFDITIENVATGKAVAYASGQFRGDTDESYRRSIAFLVNNELFKDAATQ